MIERLAVAIVAMTLIMAVSADDKGSHWIVMPNSIVPGEPLPLTFNFYNTTADILVQVDLIQDDHHLLATMQHTFTNGNAEIVQVQVPSGLHYQSRYTLLIHGLQGIYFAQQAHLRYDSGVRAETFGVLIQTDKAIYKPGQTVRFRTFGMFSNMTVYDGAMNISIYDPKGNMIKKMVNASEPVYGVVEDFMLMDSEPLLGSWRINVNVNGLGYSQKNFKVDKYVLPKFDVSVELPPYVLTSDKDMHGTVKATYTYGKPVIGKVLLTADLDYYYSPWKYHGDEVMVEMTLDINGEAKFTIPFDRISNEVNPNTYIPLVQNLNGYHVIVKASVVESINNLTRNATDKVQFFKEPYRVNFNSDQSPNYFKPGLPYTAHISIAQADGRPVISSVQDVEIVTYVKFYDHTVHKDRAHALPDRLVAPPPTGVMSVVVDPPEFAKSLHIEVHYKGFKATLNVNKPYWLLANATMQLSMNSSVAAVGQNVVFKLQSVEAIDDIFYNIISNGLMVHTGTLNGAGANDVYISFPVTTKMEPFGHLVVYYFNRAGDWNADSLYFNVNDGSAIFKNQVSLSFDKTTVEPHDNITLSVVTDPRSLVNVLAVDQSVLLMATGNDITQGDVVSKLMSAVHPSSNSVGVHDPKQVMRTYGLQVLSDVSHFSWARPFNKRQTDCRQCGCDACRDRIPNCAAYGRAVCSSFQAWVGQNCVRYCGLCSIGPMPTTPSWFFTTTTTRPTTTQYGKQTESGSATLQKVSRTRVFFPETWLWTDVISGNRAMDAYIIMDLAICFRVCVQRLSQDLCLDKHRLPSLDLCLVKHRLPILDLSLDQHQAPMNYSRSSEPGTSFQKHGYGQMSNLGTGTGGTGTGSGASFAGTPAPGTTFAPGMFPTSVPLTNLQEVKRTRTEFPETWIWSQTTAGDDGRATIKSTVPDTITSWVATAFSVNKQTGLGVADTPAKFKTFRPFFVSLNLPYSVIRGEEVVLQANVFNYMGQDMDVVLTLDRSNDFHAIVKVAGLTDYVSQAIVKNVKVAAGKAESVFIPIVASTIGTIDISVKAQTPLAADGLKRQLIVEAEGTPMHINIPMIISANTDVDIPIAFPDNFVADSQKIHVSAIGDVMGPTVKNMNHLLRLPTGCGEQTMTSLAPDVFVYNYLEASHQMTTDVKEKALHYMHTGYQRELTFQHYDGSFSIWGQRDGVGSMWLTAFVLKSFHQAKQHIFVSDSVLQKAIHWIVQYQNYDGSFRRVGSVHDTGLSGGSSSSYSLTAFVLIALLENSDTHNYRLNQAAAKARVFLEAHAHEISSPYELAITSYALAMSGSSISTIAFTKLDRISTTDHGMKYWPSPNQMNQYPGWYHSYYRNPPRDVETAAYALLYYITKQNLVDGLPVLKWLISQRNSMGGFRSTQDTVLGLQAMSEYGAMLSGHLDLNIDVTAGNFSHQIHIADTSALVLKSVEVPSNSMIMASTTGSPTATPTPTVHLSARGQGSALAQVAVSFHVETEVLHPAFNLTTNIIDETLRSIVVQACAAYKYDRYSRPGMAVIELGVPSGFSPEIDSSRTDIKDAQKTEIKDQTVYIYYDSITPNPVTCATVEMIRTELVAKTKPASVHVYDYYEPDNRALVFYESRLLKDASYCDICSTCGC